MNHNENNVDELPKGWVMARIGDVSSSPQYGWTTSATERGDLRLLRTTDITSGTIEWETVPFCKEKPPDIQKYLLEDSDVVISRAGSVGHSCLLKSPVHSVFASYLIRFRPLLFPSYFAWFLKSPTYWKEISESKLGIAIPNVNASKLKEIPLPVPPLPEQHRIVTKVEELLTRLEAGVEALKRTKAVLKRYRQSVLKAAVEGRLTQEWREAHKDDLEPASKLLERISQERRRRFVEKARDSVRAYVAARVSGAAVHNNPREMLEAFLSEMVVNDIDTSHARLLDRIAADFFGLMAGIQDLPQQIRSYLLWLRRSMDTLTAEGLKSEILINQWEAWQRYVEKEQNRKGPGREIVAIFGLGGGPMDAFSQWLTGESLRDHGAAHLRRTVIEEPADRNWKVDEAKRKANQPDTTQLPELPEGWEWTTLPQIGELNRGKSRHRPRDAAFLYGGPYPFVQTGDVKNANGYIRSYTQTYTEEGLRQSRLWRANTLCITIAANIADTAILGFDACFPDSIVGFTTEAPSCEVQFVEFSIRTVKSAIEADAPATAQKNINLATLSRLPTRFPPLAEQQRIVEELDRRLSIADEVEATVEANLKRAERLRQAILKQAFEGKLVPQDPNDEPASLLLERIREEKAEREAERAIAKRKPKPSRARKKGKSVAKASPQLPLPTE